MSSMYTNRLDALAGYPSPYALTKRVPVDVATDAANTVLEGMVGHKSPAAAGKFRLGLPLYDAVNGVAPVPLFVLGSAQDYDVAVASTDPFSNSGSAAVVNVMEYSAADAASATAGTPEFGIGTLSATGALELASTAIATDFNPGTGTLLTSPAAGPTRGTLVAAANAGSIPINTIICGVVSEGKAAADQLGAPAWLKFWTTFQVKWSA